MTVYLVQGLGYGDEGKGATVDYLVRRLGAGLVVRFNGGAQAAHNVVDPSGFRHTFAQFGSGTLAGAHTYLSKYVVVDPLALLREAEHLREHHPDPFELLHVSREALVVTPYHVAANRIAELIRGRANQHGSCGMGIGEAVEDSLHPARRRWALRVGDLHDYTTSVRALQALREHRLRMFADRAYATVKEMPGLETVLTEELERLCTPLVKWLRRCEEFVSVVRLENSAFCDSAINDQRPVVFEGAQGVLLDQDYGFQPYTTWSDCTWQNADELLRNYQGERKYLGVTRAYMTRHGAGPLVTEVSPGSELETLARSVDSNKENRWQGSLRCGWLDPVALRYSAGVLGRLDGVAVTHLDTVKQLGGSMMVCEEYRWNQGSRPFPGDGLFTLDGSGFCRRIDVPWWRPSVERQTRLCRFLWQAKANFTPVATDAHTVCGAVSRALLAPVVLTASGPGAGDRQPGAGSFLEALGG